MFCSQLHSEEGGKCFVTKSDPERHNRLGALSSDGAVFSIKVPSGKSTTIERIHPACIQPRMKSRRSLRAASWAGSCFSKSRALVRVSGRGRSTTDQTSQKSTWKKAINSEGVLEASKVAATEPRRREGRPGRVSRCAGEAPKTHSSGGRLDHLWRSVALIQQHSIFP